MWFRLVELISLYYCVVVVITCSSSNNIVSAQQESSEQEENDHIHPNAEHCEWSGGSCTWDYDLKPMTVSLEGYKETQTFFAYVEPDVSVFYNETPGTKTAKSNAFKGQFGKFVNMSPEPIRIFWNPGTRNAPDTYICDVQAFGSAGTATYPGHVFKVMSTSSPNKQLHRFSVVAGQSVHVYDPYHASPTNAHRAGLSQEQMSLYWMQHHNNEFASQYKNFTGRDWLALYQQKFPPRFHMLPADSLGEVTTITTKEIFFVELPPEQELQRGTSLYGPRPDDISRNRRYRDRYPTMELTLKVLSCAPRIFEIPNFLSDVEIDHILDLGEKQHLARSTTRAGTIAHSSDDTDTTRTSTNTWVGRHSSIITDAIYRRAADVLKIDEKFLRYRRQNEVPQFKESSIGIAENMQLVHYNVGEEYTPHHDFSMPGLVNGQPSRFATILLYLNDEGLEGGQTSFPLWLHAEQDRDALRIKPEKGKAILFYNLLPDGNYDERSQHSAMPVLSGEKWLANLWIWDPYFDHTSAAF